MTDNAPLVMSVYTLMQQVPDPRSNRAIRHPMINVLTIALCGMLCGYESFEAMAWYGKHNLKFFQTFLNMKRIFQGFTHR